MFTFPTTKITDQDYLFEAGSAKIKLSDIIDDLPDNCYVNKSITGCGATTLALINDVNYLVLVPYTNLVHSKVSQHEEVLGVTGDVKDEEISDYLTSDKKSYKIIGTYDSFKRILSNPNFNKSDFKLMVDEAHLLVTQASFRTGTCQYVLKNYTEFDKYVFVTATPTQRRFFPVEIENLPVLQIQWKDIVEANFKTYYLDSDVSMIKKLTALCLGVLLNDNEKEIHIFYNSVNEITQVLLRLKAMDGFKLERDDFRFICSKNQQVKVQDVLGKVYGKIDTLTTPVARINFYTSTAFEGGDVYSKLPNNCEQYICINGSRDHTKLDFTSTVSQIVGRIRNKSDNNIHFLISNAPESIKYSEEDWEQEVKKKIESVHRLLNDIKYNNTISEELRDSGTKTAIANNYTIYDEDINEIIVPDVALKNELQSFQALHATYYIQTPENTESKASTLKSILTEHNDYTDYEIQYEQFLLQLAGYKHFIKAMELYCEFKTLGTNKKLVSILEAVEPEFKQYYNTIGSSKIKALQYSETRIIREVLKKEAENKSLKKVPNLGFNVFYSNSDLKEAIQKFYDENKLDLKAKASDVSKWFVVKGVKKLGVNGFKIENTL